MSAFVRIRSRVFRRADLYQQVRLKIRRVRFAEALDGEPCDVGRSLRREDERRKTRQAHIGGQLALHLGEWNAERSIEGLLYRHSLVDRFEIGADLTASFSVVPELDVVYQGP